MKTKIERMYHNCGALHYEFHFIEGTIIHHREDGPALIKFYRNGIIQRNEYLLNGLTHRIDGPAKIIYDLRGEIQHLQYLINGKWHREDGPAIIEYDEFGHERYHTYMYNNNFHRAYGPSDITFDINGNIKSIEWYYNNICYDKTVSEWIKNNNFNSWTEMSESDFDRMWMEIL